MTIFKSIIKYIPFTLKALTIAFLAILVPIVVINIAEYFQPKTIFIDNIEITAPKGTRLLYAYVDHEDIQTPFSSFLFQNTYQYTFPELWGAMFLFQAISRNSDTRLLHLEISVDTSAKTANEAEDNFRKYIVSHEKKEEYKKIESKECFGYTERDKKVLYTAHVFHNKEVVNILISSDSIFEIRKALHQFCTDIPIEGKK